MVSNDDEVEAELWGGDTEYVPATHSTFLFILS